MANLVQIPARVEPEMRDKLLRLAELLQRRMRHSGAHSAEVTLADAVREVITRGASELERELCAGPPGKARR